MNIKVVQKEGKYGVVLNEIEVVPFCHDTKYEAIKEWAHFETINHEPKNNLWNPKIPLNIINDIVNLYKDKN